jgi:predicted HTH transcriptional regulator
LIAGAFHRTGAVEVWGRGTNRVIAMCKKHGAIAPMFEDRNGFLIVTFRAALVESAQQEAGEQSGAQSTTQSSDPVIRLLTCLAQGEMSAGQLRSLLRLKHRPTFRENYLHPALAAEAIALTLPDKPNSRLQKYRLTAKGKAILEKAI